MEPWRQHLEASFAALNKKTSKTVEAVSDSLKAAMSSVECEHCQLKCFEADMLTLPCQHSHCNDCIADQIERIVGFIERHHRQIGDLTAVEGILVCSNCHEVCAVKRKTVFTGCLHSKDRGTLARNVFEVDQERTKVLKNGSEVRRGYENERRVIGRFHANNLFRFERKAFTSCDALNRPLDKKLIDAELVAASKVWIEDWNFDKSSGDPQGWQYALNWPKNKDDWLMEPSATTFVRRRGVLRACVATSALSGSESTKGSQK